MIDTKRARVRLLSLAFQGQLIDFPRKERQNDVLETLHKAQKKYLPVTEVEHLITVPPYWHWSRLGYVTSNHGQTVPDKDFCYIDVGTLDNIRHRLAATENLVSAKDAPSRARKVVEMGDVLYSTVRPYLHNICIVDREFSRIPIASTAFCVMQANKNVLLNRFLFYWLLTAEFDKYSNGDPSKGALYPAIGEKDLLRGVIPIPSMEEQYLIVAKIDAAFSALDTIDTLQAQYAENLTVLKSKVMDAAIQGKLTEQLPEDGTADELYLLIQAEKQAMIEAGAIKKEKSLPDITEKDIPFKIPDNWKWVTLGSITTKITSGSTPTGGRKSNVYVKKGFPFLREQNIYDDGIHQAGMVYITEELLNTRQNSTVFAKDILLNITGGSIGRCALVPDNFDRGSINQHILIIRAVDPETRFYIHNLICSPYVQSYIKNKAVGDKDGFSGGRCKKLLVPLPPLNEQKRITETLNCLLSTIEEDISIT